MTKCKKGPIRSMTHRFFPAAALLLFLSIHLALAVPVLADHITEQDVERYVLARIAIGESMRDFFKVRKPPQFGPEGGPSMEELRKLEDEINAHLTEVLSKYDLSIDQYQENSPDIFAEEEAVQAFLAAHPDLKERYEKLPQSPRRGRSGR